MKQYLGEKKKKSDLEINKDHFWFWWWLFFLFVFFPKFWPNDQNNIFQNTLEATNLLIVFDKSMYRKLCRCFETAYTTTYVKREELMSFSNAKTALEEGIFCQGFKRE